MQPSGYSPYKHKDDKKRGFSLRLPKIGGGLKKWLIIIIGIVLALFFACYLCLGELRFFANNYLRLTFFDKDYLILLQNNYETRPTGGFITGYGEIGATMGFVSDISFHNSYEIDTDTYVTPPYPHEELLENEWYEGYTFRDANWNPDFPSSALELIDFYQKKFPDKDVDGIIVVNFSMVEDLVEKLGGLEVDGEQVDANDLFKTLTDIVNDVDRHDETALIERKSILGEIATSLVPKASWHPFKTKKVILDALESKDLYMWFKSEGMQRKIEKKGWANRMELAENSDFLHVNLANLGSKKADRYLIKEVFHHVNILKEIPEITTEIMVRYPGSKNIYADDYKGYLRVYIPATATVQSDTLGASVETEGGFKVIGTQLILPAGSKSTIGYTYQLPRTLLPLDTYQLRLIKQSGDNKSYTVTVESHGDSAITSDDFDTMENKAIWRSIPVNDVDLDLHLGEDTSSPYPIEQVFEKLNTVAIYWNESIEVSSGGDALNYEIVDANQTNSELTDEVKVVYAEVIDGSVSKLELDGVTEQELERYKITLKNIKDQAGNAITPDPKEITVVQRIVAPPIPEERSTEPLNPAAFELD